MRPCSRQSRAAGRSSGSSRRGYAVVNTDATVIAPVDIVALPDAKAHALSSSLRRRMTPAISRSRGVVILIFSDAQGKVLSTPDRRTLFAVQTPQVFQADILRTSASL